MHRIVRVLLLIGFLTAGFAVVADAQKNDTIPPVAVDPKLLELVNQTVPQEYYIRNITVAGNKTLDPSIIISISGLSTGDKVTIPGSDNFSRAIANLWKQNLLANVSINYTAVQGDQIDVEIEIVERPRLSKIVFKGAKKTDEEDLTSKAGLVLSRVVTENVKKTAKENIIK